MNIGRTIAPSLLNALQARVQRWGKQQDDSGARRWEKHDGHRGLRRFGRFRPETAGEAPELSPARSDRAAEGRSRVTSREKLDYRAWTAEGSTSAGLTIRTDEGDVVTISRSTTAEISYSSLRYKSRDENGTLKVSQKTQQFSYSEQLSLTVEGDLNEQELADIQKFLDRIGPALEDFQSEGDMAGVLAVDGAEFESLAGFEFTFAQTWNFTAVHARRRAVERESTLARPERDGFRLGPPASGWTGGGSIEDMLQALDGLGSSFGPPPSSLIDGWGPGGLLEGFGGGDSLLGPPPMAEREG